MIVDRIVKRNFGNQYKNPKPQQIFHFVAGMQKTLYQKKTVDGKGDTPNIADQAVEQEHVLVKTGICLDCRKSKTACPMTVAPK